MINIALCGYGYWGPNLFRNFRDSPHFEVVAVADRDPGVFENKLKSLAGAQIYHDAAEAIADPRVEAVVIATPVQSHFPLARAALQQGKHVLVEKPLCESPEEAEELTALAERAGLALMIDHTFLFHPAVRKLTTLVRDGSLGDISYYDSLRVNLGLFRPDVNVLWDLAPHDLSIIDHLFGEEPVHVQANGYCHVNPRSPDIAYLTLYFANNLVAHLNLSWMSPTKVRRTAIGGSKKMAVWDDLDRDEPIRIYDSGITVRDDADRNLFIQGYRIGDVHSPRLPNEEALAGVVRHFAQVIMGKETSIMDGRQGVRVVRTLSRAQTSIDESLALVRDLSTQGGHAGFR